MRRGWLLLGLGVAALVAWRLLPPLPPGWNPSAPLDFRDAPTLITGWKLLRLDQDPAACFAAFAVSGQPVARLPDQRAGTECEVSPAVRLNPPGISLHPPGPLASCRLGAAWEMFQRHALQPASVAAFGQPVVAVHQLGTYACRNVAGTAQRSRHSHADAIDIAAFTLRDGRQVSVAADWNDPDAKGRFLRAVHDGACRWFGTVLGPDYNTAHRDHFHLDVGGWSACR